MMNAPIMAAHIGTLKTIAMRRPRESPGGHPTDPSWAARFTATRSRTSAIARTRTAYPEIVEEKRSIQVRIRDPGSSSR
jgi:hypothetical protein